MERDRWKRIEQLYYAALERGPDARESFLDEACAGDEDMRREVAGLIACDVPNDSFIQSPAIEIAAKALAAEPLIEASTKSIKAPIAGSQIGAYQLLSPLGRGGMGEVHLALDTRLRRKVAIKLLPAEFTADIGRVRRFEQEARAASALNHPNIITVHEIGEAHIEGGNRRYIVTEYVEGETLRQRMNGEPQQRLNLSEAIDVASQIAAALSAAHQAGIAHRDIKPENVMARRDGIVKVLDFGLAKLTEGQGDGEAEGQGEGEAEGQRDDGWMLSPSLRLSVSPSLTGAGTVMGTPRYMSPEQARGEKVDVRTDIFSLGVTLYEMITGRQPFAGEKPGEMIAAILHDEPPPLAEYAPEAPPELQRLVDKALRKNREERYQGVKDLLLDLKALKQDLELKAREASVRTGETGAARATSGAQYIISEIKRRKRGTLLALAVVAGIAFGLYRVIGFNRSRIAKPAPPLPAIKFERLTNNGKAVSAAISPDGKYVAYAEAEAGRQSLWIRQTNIANAKRIVPSALTCYYWLSFSRDGDILYYLTDDAFDGNSLRKTLYQIPVFGSAIPRKVIANIWGASVALSPDGKRLAFVRWNFNQSERALMLANVDGSGEQKLAARNYPGAFLRDLAWSPDGNIISCSSGNTEDGALETVIGVNVTDGTQRQITPPKLVDVRNMAWLADGSGLIMQARDPAEGPQPQLWRLSYPEGEARKLTNDLNNYHGVSLAANSNTLVTVKADYSINIWIAPYDKPDSAIQITSGTNIEEGLYGLAWTPDDKIVYASAASENWDLWIVDADGSHKQQLTSGAGRNVYPTVSPDGRYVVFNSDRTGVEEIWRMDTNGANLKQLTSSRGALRPYCSPDGRWVVYRNDSSGKVTLWKVSIDGGAQAQLVSGDKPANNPVISPDGKQISYIVLNERDKPALNILPFEGGAIIKTIELPTNIKVNSHHVWTPDGRAVICRHSIGDVSNLLKLPLDGSPPSKLTDFKSNGIAWFALSRSGKQLALSRGDGGGEVELISNFR
jgi:serine/threonine protein kinase/Tol biopolymer transport system component